MDEDKHRLKSGHVKGGVSEGSAEGELTVSSRAGDVATAGHPALLLLPEGSI